MSPAVQLALYSITAPWVSWRPDRYSSETDYGELRRPLKLSGHYMYRTVVTVCTAQWSLYVPHSGHYMYRTVVTICTAQWSLYVLHSLCNLLHSPVTSSLLGPNIFLNILFSNTLSFLSSRNVNDQVSHLYKTAGKIVFLYILIFKFLDSNLEDKRFCTE